MEDRIFTRKENLIALINSLNKDILNQSVFIAETEKELLVASENAKMTIMSQIAQKQYELKQRTSQLKIVKDMLKEEND